GYAARVTDVLALEVEDRPGGLAAILKVVEQAGISVEYMYAFAVKCQGDAILVFRFDQIDKAIAALNAAGINCIEPHQLFARYHAENKELGE
ncbi:MAG TPA: ACT domain-containing protein, partial [Firmicutes bacterium]|nr:ACT domain-containing protein [Bacillota bacterium]